jgi:hypothetical protein
LTENPLKFLCVTYDSLKKHHNFSKNIDLLAENNFKNREECFSWAPNISYFSLKQLAECTEKGDICHRNEQKMGT